MALILLIFLFFCNSSYSFDFSSFPVQTYGNVRIDNFLDSRQATNFQDIVFFFPLPQDYDVDGEDINDRSRTNIVAVATRIGFKLDDYYLNNTKILGIIETDFIGSTGFFVFATEPLRLIPPGQAGSQFLSHLRMRDAYVQLSWADNSKVLVGHYDHLLCPRECKPEVVSFNTGVPIELFARESQVRYTKRFDNIEFAIAFHEQVDFQSDGPSGPSPQYLRDAIIPDTAVTIKYYLGESIIGVVLDFKRLVPRLTSNGPLVDQMVIPIDNKEHINGFIGEIYFNFKSECSEFKGKLIYEDNATEFASLGSYAVKTDEPGTDFRTYANIPVVAFWLEYIYNFNENYQFGVFGGYAKKLGAGVPLFVDPFTLEPIIFGLEPNIEYVYRFSPRFKYKSGSCEVGFELELTGAAYGKNNEFGDIPNSRVVNNLRILTAVTYYF